MFRLGSLKVFKFSSISFDRIIDSTNFDFIPSNDRKDSYQWKSEKAEGFVDKLSTKPSAFSDFH